MRLLGWMQHKLWQNSIEPFKDFTSGNYCTCFSAKSSLNDQDSYSKPTFGTAFECRSSMQSRQECKNSSGAEANLEDGEGLVFHGFLSIGTLGSEQIISDSETPRFTMSLENIAEEETDVTEIDLKLINDELEKFLEAEAEGKGSNESSKRNSQVSAITLNGKPMEGAYLEEYGWMICPLQGYLFGSSIDLPETRTEGKKDKASLAELFKREKVTDGSSTEKYGKEEMQAKQTNKSVKHRIMKILNKLQSSSTNSSTSPKETYSVSTKKRFQKVIKMFHRKIHPASSAAERELKKSKKYMINNTPQYGFHLEGDQMHQDKDDCKFCQRHRSQEGRQCCKTNSKQPQSMLAGSTSSGNREHWIRTDANWVSTPTAQGIPHQLDT
ncbi:hypothetical protein SLEP1_g35485 [Rubroshorea leprosula]|uniref:Protein LAZY 1-like n=1 Tax=Rubroshorea leprosula TaxID=152421 RepID=A0AAV5KNF3_9ROSI|nr:hypothetical protein SLEP1_g35485 [Rubroshorea leprosula]